MNLTALLLATWTWNAGLTLAAAAAVAAFGVWSRGRTGARLGQFVAAAVLLAAALSSPVNALASGVLFSAHMAQHLVLLVIVPGLVMLSLGAQSVRSSGGSPLSVMASGAPPLLRRARPLLGWLAGVGAMYFWHIPALCDAASASAPVHAVQTISLLGCGWLFWKPILSPAAADRVGAWTGIAYLFSACLACTALGILLTLTPIEVCPGFAAPADPFGLLPQVRGAWGITAARDRAVGGLLMWVPMCSIYLSAILLELTRWYGAPAPARREVPS